MISYVIAAHPLTLLYSPIRFDLKLLEAGLENAWGFQSSPIGLYGKEVKLLGLITVEVYHAFLYLVVTLG